MGHKGVSKRKLPKEKSKPLATANRGTGLIAGLSQSNVGPEKLPGKARAMPFGQAGINSSSGSKKGNKTH